MKQLAVVLLAVSLLALIPLNASANEFGKVDILIASAVVADGDGGGSITWTLTGTITQDFRTAVYQLSHPYETGTLSSDDVDAYTKLLEDRILAEGFTIGLVDFDDINSNATATGLDGAACTDDGEVSITLTFTCTDAGMDSKPINAAAYTVIWPGDVMPENAYNAEIEYNCFTSYIGTSGIAVVDSQKEGTFLGFGIVQILYYGDTYENYAALSTDAENAKFSDQACCFCCTIFLVGAGAAGSLAIVALRRRQ